MTNRSNAAAEYRNMQTTTIAKDGPWDATFDSYVDASHCGRLAGGRDARRTGAAWTWTMPDKWTATLSDDAKLVAFAPPSAGDERAKLQHAADLAWETVLERETAYMAHRCADKARQLADACTAWDAAMLELGKLTTNPHA